MYMYTKRGGNGQEMMVPGSPHASGWLINCYRQQYHCNYLKHNT